MVCAHPAPQYGHPAFERAILNADRLARTTLLPVCPTPRPDAAAHHPAPTTQIARHVASIKPLIEEVCSRRWAKVPNSAPPPAHLQRSSARARKPLSQLFITSERPLLARPASQRARQDGTSSRQFSLRPPLPNPRLLGYWRCARRRSQLQIRLDAMRPKPPRSAAIRKARPEARAQAPARAQINSGRG